MILVQFASTVVLLMLSLTAPVCHATPPLSDVVEYRGETSTIQPFEVPWLPLRENEETRKIRRTEGCTMIGAPRARWKIQDNGLWLVGLFGCSRSFRLADVYGGSNEPIFAEWVSERFIFQSGKPLCRPKYGDVAVRETEFHIQVRQGVVIALTEHDNRDHPRLPTVEKLRRLFGPGDAHKAEDAAADFPCLDSSDLNKLDLVSPANAGTRSANTPAYVEHLREHAKKLFGE